jgi:DMSO/TMAO reductase YedYZ molybdopterin-dependent catalytic subunit
VSQDDKLERIVRARMRLKERFEEKMRATPAAADAKPRGSGPPNRHGMPQLPPGQTETKKWPVLDLGMQPEIDPREWKLTIDGAVAEPITLDWNGLMALEQVRDVSDFHCVTAWSRFDIPWIGVRVADVIALAMPRDDATHLMCHGYDGYTTNVALEEALKPDVLLAHHADGAPLPTIHGGPVRMITPQLYAWKGSKWVKRLELMTRDRRGFWEERGYSNSAHPWRNDRYS